MRDWLEWQRYEAVTNAALAPLPLWSLCIYDTDLLAPQVLRSGRCNHSPVIGPLGRVPNPSFTDPADVLRGLRWRASPCRTTLHCWT